MQRPIFIIKCNKKNVSICAVTIYGIFWWSHMENFLPWLYKNSGRSAKSNCTVKPLQHYNVVYALCWEVWVQHFCQSISNTEQLLCDYWLIINWPIPLNTTQLTLWIDIDLSVTIPIIVSIALGTLCIDTVGEKEWTS